MTKKSGRSPDFTGKLSTFVEAPTPSMHQALEIALEPVEFPASNVLRDVPWRRDFTPATWLAVSWALDCHCGKWGVFPKPPRETTRELGFWDPTNRPDLRHIHKFDEFWDFGTYLQQESEPFSSSLNCVLGGFKVLKSDINRFGGELDMWREDLRSKWPRM